MMNIQNIYSLMRRYLVLSLFIALSIAVYAMRLDDVVGMFRDDAWYALLAKSIATGNGYSLINSPSPGITPIYPPFFPFLLSFVFRLIPDFPDNLFYLKLISITAMFGAGILSFFYYKQGDCSNRLAVVLALLVLLSPGLVFIATSSLMSECVFTLVYLGSIVVIETLLPAARNRTQYLVTILAGILVSATFLTRSIAIALFLSVCLHFIIKKKAALLAVFVATVGLIVGSWLIYSRIHSPTPQQRAEVNSYITVPYSEQFWDRKAGFASEGKITLAELPGRIISNLSSVGTLDIGGIVTPSFFPALNQGLAERYHLYQTVISLLVVLLISLGYYQSVRSNLTISEIFLPLYLAIVLAWPFPPYRFLLPILPIFLLYFIRGWERIVSLHVKLLQNDNGKDKADHDLGLMAISVILLVFTIYGNASYIDRKFSNVENERPRWIRIFDETEKILNWVKLNMDTDRRIITENPALVHLYSGHKTITYDNPSQHWDLWKTLNIRYYVSVLPGQSSFNSSNSSPFKVVHYNTGPLNLKVVDLGPAESRKDWKPGAN
jgi:hypothetical protein